MDIQELISRNTNTHSIRQVRDTRDLRDFNNQDTYNRGIQEVPGVILNSNTPGFLSSLQVSKPFIEANTLEVDFNHLQNECIIPVFSKDNEKTIAHQEFIEIAQECTYKAFPNNVFETPEIRVSHQIKGRTPDAIHKNVKDLLNHEKTIYYERMAFIMRIPVKINKKN